MILLADKKMNVRSTKRFDLRFEGNPYRCHCKRIDKLVPLVDYVCKDRDYLTNSKQIIGGSYVPFGEFLLQQYNEVGVEDTADYYI